MRRHLRFALLALAALSSSGCISILQAKKDKVAGIHRVAIVGYEGVLRLDDGSSSDGVTAMVRSVKGSIDAHSGKLAARRVEQGQLAYQALGQRLTQAFGWQVAPSEALGRATAYRAVVERSPTPRDVQYVPGVLSPGQVNVFSQAERRSLCAALGVDAVATAEVRYEAGSSSGFSVGGLGSRTKYPLARVHFMLLDAAGETIWEDYDAHGRASRMGLKTTMGADLLENETEALTDAAGSGFDAVVARYRALRP
jgi:hypothetical protein